MIVKGGSEIWLVESDGSHGNIVKVKLMAIEGTVLILRREVDDYG